jgi:prefoldin subunit 5
MKTIMTILKSLCLLAAIFALAEAGLASRDIAKLTKAAAVMVTEAVGAAIELRKTATAVSEYAQHQTKQLMDPRNQKALDAGIQAPAVFNGTGRLINREVIPRAMDVLDNLSNATASLDRAIQTTDKSVNADLLPESRRLLQTTSEAISVTKGTIDEASRQIAQTGSDIHAILADPALKSIVARIDAIATHADGITANIEESSKQMPLIAADIERIAATSSRYRKAILLSQIMSALARAFF